MTGFRYEALDAAGRRVAGTVEADGPRTARQSLRTRGLTPVTVEAAGPAAAVPLPGLGLGGRVFGASELALTTTQLGALLQAGLPVAEALRALAGMLPRRRQAALLLDLRDRIAEGGTLATALAAHRHTFPPFFAAAVEAGEQAGGLPEVLERLSGHLENAAALRRELLSALFYPMLIALVAAAVVLVLFTHVVPQLATVFAGSHAELPALTTAVLALSTAVTTHGLAILAAIVAAWVAAIAFVRSAPGRVALDRAVLAVPGAGAVYRRLHLAAFVRTLAVVVGCGQPMVPALALALPVIGSPSLRAACAAAAEAVRRGEPLRAALERTGVFPPLVMGLIATGEAAGALPAMLDRAARLEEADLRTRLSALVKLVEPLLILAVGGVVLVVVLAVLVPILDLNRLLSV